MRFSSVFRLPVLLAVCALFLLILSPETARVSMGSEGPDLVVEEICLYAEAPYEWVAVTVRNVGTSAAGPSETKVVGAYVDYLTTPALLPGEEAVVGTSHIIPLVTTYTAVADWNGAVVETDEMNNSLTTIVEFGTCSSTPIATATPDPPVGGMAEAPDHPDRTSSGDSWSILALPAGIAGLALLAAYGWYARRRFVRQRR